MHASIKELGRDILKNLIFSNLSDTFNNYIVYLSSACLSAYYSYSSASDTIVDMISSLGVNHNLFHAMIYLIAFTLSLVFLN